MSVVKIVHPERRSAALIRVTGPEVQGELHGTQEARIPIRPGHKVTAELVAVESAPGAQLPELVAVLICLPHDAAIAISVSAGGGYAGMVHCLVPGDERRFMLVPGEPMPIEISSP